MRQKTVLFILGTLMVCALVQAQAGARKARSDPVRASINRAQLSGSIDALERSRYLASYSSSLRTLRHLSGLRRTELSYVVRTVQRIARAGRLTAGRMRPLFLILDRNREWWSASGPPAANYRVHFGSSPVVFQYYPGRGLQLQPLANFGLANGYWSAHKDAALRAMIYDLVDLRVNRGGFTAWEYYFDFGGGSPPWVSGMTQATAMQALARASKRLGDPQLLEIARQARPAFERATPTGVRVPVGSRAWYALYSFAPRLQVLNGMLQSLIGLDTYVSFSGDAQAKALFDQGDSLVRARIRDYDTGAWSLYSRSPGHAGAEASLNYHLLNRDFARRLCGLTDAAQYCEAADNFDLYLEEDPTLNPFGASPDPAKGGRAVSFRFTLSKVGRVGITVTGGGRTYLSTSAAFAHGRHYFRWVPPRVSHERSYEYKLVARDLAGNTGSEVGELSVKRATPKKGK
jgi:hypothetical protein